MVKMAAKAIVQVTETEQPPLRLLLGAGAMKGGRRKLDELKADFDAWETITLGADRPKA